MKPSKFQDNILKRLFKQLYINNLFVYALLGIITLFACAFFFPFLYSASWYLFIILSAFLVLDILILFLAKIGVEAQRNLAEKLSNGDENPIGVSIKNYYTFAIQSKIIDEILRNDERYELKKYSFLRLI